MISEEQRQELIAWNARRFEPPYPMASRFLTEEEYQVVKEERQRLRAERVRERESD